MIPVTKPFLPPRQEYESLLAGVWERNLLTNNGPLVVELERKLSNYLGIRDKEMLFVSNGTVALQLAIKALGLNGEIITTPFSYVATSSSIVWEGCHPVYVDINPDSLTIDVSTIENAIGPSTCAILATHVYGNPCDVDVIDQIAKRHKLKVIYDAAHAFGVTYRGRSIYSYGDISTASFHATKLFHTVEGGAVFAQDSNLLARLAFMRNFGHDGPGKFNGIGINGKNSEFHAAMGLANLGYVDQIIARRKNQCARYDEYFKSFPELKLVTSNAYAVLNHAYYPIIFESEAMTLKVLDGLLSHHIEPRRYFYPSLNEVDVYKGPRMAVSESISRRVICLPLFHELSFDQIDFIASLVCELIKKKV